MKSVALLTMGSLGDLNPYLAIAYALRDRGIRPIIVTSPSRRQQIEALGLAFRPMRPELTPESAVADGTMPQILDPHGGTEFLIRTLIAPHIRQSYDDILAAVADVDLIFTHPITFAGRLVAEKLSIPWASGVLAPASILSDYDPFVVPQTRLFQTLRPAGAGAIGFLHRAVRRYTYPWVKPIINLRVELGLTPGDHPLFEGQHSPKCVLALFSRAIATPQPDWPSNVTITGFPFLDGTDQRLPDDLERFLDTGEPPIVFTLGSSAVLGAGSFYSESAKAALSLGKRAVLLTGSDPSNRNNLPNDDKIFATPSAPYSLLLRRGCCTVHSGGIGSTGEGLRSGKPMLIVPFSNDQPDNANRARRIGAAAVLDKSNYRAVRVALKLNRLLSQPSYATASEKASQIIAAERGADSAAEQLAKLL